MIERYADPAAATATLTQVRTVVTTLESLNLSLHALGELATLFAVSYISRDGGPDDVRAYYAECVANGETEAMRIETLEVLAWTALFGPNGSEGQRTASASLKRAPGYAHH